jgi:adenylate cyclase
MIAPSRILGGQICPASEERDMISLPESPVRPFAEPRRDTLAVLFVDLDGYTRLCSEKDLGTILALVQAFQERVTHSVLEWGGTLNNYLGDGAMATFTHSAGDRSPASRALRCASVLSARIGTWNRERELTGQPAVSISIGAQYGEVISGTVGTEQRSEVTVLGDAVNVASRLTNLAQRLGVGMAAGEDLVNRVFRERGGSAPELCRFVRLGPWPLRGKEMPVAIWVLPRQSADTRPLSQEPLAWMPPDTGDRWPIAGAPAP